jgi:hypothetical protein
VNGTTDTLGASSTPSVSIFFTKTFLSNRPLTHGNQVCAASRRVRDSFHIYKAFRHCLRHPAAASAPSRHRICCMQRGLLPTAFGGCLGDSGAGALAHCGRNQRAHVPRTAPTPPPACAAQVRSKTGVSRPRQIPPSAQRHSFTHNERAHPHYTSRPPCLAARHPRNLPRCMAHMQSPLQ